MASPSPDAVSTSHVLRLRMDQVHVREPLPFDTYDDRGKLLLRRGQIIQSQDQLQRLVDRGLYRVRSTVSHDLLFANEYAPKYAGRKISIFALIEDIQQSLERLLRNPPRSGFASATLDLARTLQRACTLDADAALAHSLLTKNNANCLRHSLHAAIVAELLLSQLERAEATRVPVIAAAFTMNMTIVELQDQLYHQASAVDDAQHAEMSAHPRACVARLRELGVDDPLWLAAVEQHHEAYDGSGYPAGLAGEAILVDAQVLSLADCFCAMVSERAYRPAALPNAALKELFLSQGKTIHPRLAALLVKEVGIFPPGSLVALANREVAVVVKRTLNAKHPVVKSFISSMGTRLPGPIKRLTSDPKFAVERVVAPHLVAYAPPTDQLWEAAFEISAAPGAAASAGQANGEAENAATPSHH